MNKEVERLVKVTRRLLDNIYEFGAPTDSIFVEQVEDAVTALEITPPLKYWQHDDTGRLLASPIKPSERWYEITESQYDMSTPSKIGSEPKEN